MIWFELILLQNTQLTSISSLFGFNFIYLLKEVSLLSSFSRYALTGIFQGAFSILK